ncbi:two-component system response regulator [Thaumasiovibrio subtropicus]|uniref:two-component system response regulator n=1 Tax=Thaumasiovibrio subtropicus TaxID=1891207 RepID=UPI000B34B9BF|nr:EAL domain-containing protein [Thaumasiovibrio subtropicus]
MSAKDNELVEFINDEPTADLVEEAKRWVVLIVDDDEDVHASTKYGLKDAKIQGMGIEFIDAYSASEAIPLIKAHKPAVMLLDVVMESEIAGLELVSVIRDDICDHNVQIILRTGQPGYAPELDTIEKYQINDYKTKTELTREKLYTTIASSIRAYQHISRLNRQQLRLSQILELSNLLIHIDDVQQFPMNLLSQLANMFEVEDNGFIYYWGVESGDDPTFVYGSGRYADEANITPYRLQVETLFHEQQSVTDNQFLMLLVEPEPLHRYVVGVEVENACDLIGHDMLAMLTRNIMLCAKNTNSVSRLRYVAFVDRLTKLPNRNALLRYLEDQRYFNTQSMALSLIDIDDFSLVVDTFGYDYGDEVLRQAMQRLKKELPPNGYIARIGADVFALVYPIGNLVVEALMERFNAPFMIDSHIHRLTVSAGTAGWGSDQTGQTLLNEAYIALKRAKRSGNNCHVLFENAILAEMHSHSMMLKAMKQGLVQSQFSLHFQPQVSLTSEKVFGVEALLRWTDHHGAIIPPAQFIPIAEQSGFIVELGRWVLKEAQLASQILLDAGYDIKVAVNISAVQFQQADFIDTLQETLLSAPSKATEFELEITESVGMLNIQDTHHKLQKLSEQGFTIAIDDFGTGFSSLSYLDGLRADTLKIDRSFINKLTDSNDGQRIAEMIIALGQQLHMTVLAEGVETVSQLARLKLLGCGQAQGYFFAKPMPMEALLSWLEKRDVGRDNE